MLNHRADLLRLWKEKKPLLHEGDGSSDDGPVLDRLEAVIERRNSSGRRASRDVTVIRTVRKDGTRVETTVSLSADEIATFVDPIEEMLRAMVRTLSDMATEGKEEPCTPTTE